MSLIERIVKDRGTEVLLAEARYPALGRFSRRALGILAGFALAGRALPAKADGCTGPGGTGHCNEYVEDACDGSDCGICGGYNGCGGEQCWHNGSAWCCDCYCDTGGYEGYCYCTGTVVN
ncbi:MAG TPA: hypothetical protein VN700_01885 [Vicinamibacterales bacterium]|nr:hypothetical protein [Vicinamibacterales bacterium]